jgi:hypothetical protein
MSAGELSRPDMSNSRALHAVCPRARKRRLLCVGLIPRLKVGDSVIDRVRVRAADRHPAKELKAALVLPDRLVAAALEEVPRVELRLEPERAVPLLEPGKERERRLAAEAERVVEEVEDRLPDHAVGDEPVVLRSGADHGRDGLREQVLEDLVHTGLDGRRGLLVEGALERTSQDTLLVHVFQDLVGIAALDPLDFITLA